MFNLCGGDAQNKLLEQCNLHAKHPTARSRHGHLVATSLYHIWVSTYSVVRSALTYLVQRPTTLQVWSPDGVVDFCQGHQDVVKFCNLLLQRHDMCLRQQDLVPVSLDVAI